VRKKGRKKKGSQKQNEKISTGKQLKEEKNKRKVANCRPRRWGTDGAGPTRKLSCKESSNSKPWARHKGGATKTKKEGNIPNGNKKKK